MLIGAALADETADYAALLAGVPQRVTAAGEPGSVALWGYHNFAVLTDHSASKEAPAYWAVVAAGYYADDLTRSRAVVFAHACWAEPDAGRARLLDNALRWTGRKPQPVVALASGLDPQGTLAARGFTVRRLPPQLGPKTDWTGVDALLLDPQRTGDMESLRAAGRFVADGGGLVVVATPAALSAERRQAVDSLLHLYNMALNTAGQRAKAYETSPHPYSPYFSAAHALDGLLDDRTLRRRMELDVQRLAVESIARVLGSGAHAESIENKLERLERNFGWIKISQERPLRVAERPVEALLVRRQAMKLDVMPPAKLPPHPSASDWPGRVPLCAAVTKTITIAANAPPPRLVNCGEKGLWIPTGLYARPGEVVRVQIPPDKVGAGLQVLVGVHVDENFHHDVWLRHPKVVRRDPLTQEVTEIGCAFGGLVTIVVPPGAQLGSFPVTIRGAVEAPHFQLGAMSDDDWNHRARHAPGAWGVLEAPGITLYVSSKHLAELTNPTAVMTYWSRALTTADKYMGYPDRRRGEAALCDRQIISGAGHDGYPVMMAYGDSPALIRESVANGDWGFFHELGHTYQRAFEWNYTIATTPEIDVELVPAMLLTLLHQQFTVDNSSNSPMDARERLRQRKNFDALPAEERTWKTACERADHRVAFDFYFNLAEAFGWDLYGRALGRIYRHARHAPDEPEFNQLDRRDPNFLRNRFFLAFCQESGHNLTDYFERYGLGRGEYGLSATVKARVASLPVWKENRPVASLSKPEKLSVAEDAPPGTALYTFKAVDPDPGTVFFYDIVAGNDDGAFSIDRAGGVLRTASLDFERRRNCTLTVRVRDNALPGSALTQTATVDVANAAEPPRLRTGVFSVQNWSPPGTVVGALAADLDEGRTIADWSIQAGNERTAFLIDPTGRLLLLRPDAVPSLGMLSLKVQVVDSAGQADANWIYLVCGRPTGANIEIWNDGAVNRSPRRRDLAADFQASDGGENYVCRLTAYLVPPQSGAYTFYIASHGEGFLHLSGDASPGSKREIAKLLGDAGPQEWDRDPRQRSAPQRLEAGRIYYIEALHHAHSGQNRVEVGWEGPGFGRQVIPGSALMPATAMRVGM